MMHRRDFLRPLGAGAVVAAGEGRSLVLGVAVGRVATAVLRENDSLLPGKGLRSPGSLDCWRRAEAPWSPSAKGGGTT